MSISEMTTVQGLIMMWKTVHLERPGHLRQRLQINEDWSLELERPRLKFTDRCYRWRTTRTWNQMPKNLRMEMSISTFK